MKRNTILFFTMVIILISATGSFAMKRATFPNLFEPSTIAVDSNNLYITQETSIFIHSLTDFSQVKRFGTEGDRKGEFIIMPSLPLHINVRGTDIMVNSLGKIAYFSKKGTFIKELKTTPDAFLFQPLRDRFVGTAVAMTQDLNKNSDSKSDKEKNIIYRTINIYDPQLKPVKKISGQPHEFQEGKGLNLFSRSFLFDTNDDKLFVASGNDFVIDIFDISGKKISTLKHPFQGPNITEDIKNKILTYLKTSPTSKDIYQSLEPISFAPRFPAIQTLVTEDHKIYVMTWKQDPQNKENRQFFVFDLTGKLLKDLYLPVRFINPMEPYPFTIKDNQLFQLVENIGTKQWELYIFPIQ